MIPEEQIIEYLEHCSTTESCHKDKCPCLKDGHTCIAFESKPVLNFINHQKAEIESLKIANEKMYIANKKQEKNIDRLEHQLEALCLILKLAKAEAIKEFAERVKERFSGVSLCNNGFVNSTLDNLVKEMVGDG